MIEENLVFMGKKTSLILERMTESSTSTGTSVSRTAIMVRDNTELFMYCAHGLAGCRTTSSSPSK